MAPTSNEMLKKIKSARSLLADLAETNLTFFRKRKNRSDRPEPITPRLSHVAIFAAAVELTASARVKSSSPVRIS
jgi:hypothetical protein